MGNQPSRIIEKTKRNRSVSKKTRRSSTVSHRNVPIQHSSNNRRPSVASILSMSTPSFVKRRKPSSVKSPEDLRELDRLQRQHYLLKHARKTNCYALNKMETPPNKILDVGTGSGIWALEIASECPDSEIISIGFRSVLDQTASPSNLEYVTIDLYKPWTDIESNSMDIVYQRALGHNSTKEQWQHLLSESIRVLKPGGYIEWVENDMFHHNPGPILEAFDQYRQEESLKKNVDFYYTKQFTDDIKKLESIELIDHILYDIPIGEWHTDSLEKQLGFINLDIQKAFYRNQKSFYCSAWSIPPDDYDTAVQALLVEFEEFKCFSRYHCWLATKKIE